MTPTVAQIPNIPVPTTFAELWLQLGWILVIALFVIVFLLFQLARIHLSSRAKRAENEAAVAVVEAKNAGIVADLAIQAMKFRDELDTAKAVIKELTEKLSLRDEQSRQRDVTSAALAQEHEQVLIQLADLQKQVNTLSADNDSLRREVAEKTRTITERDATIAESKTQMSDLHRQIEELTRRVAELEKPHTGDTGRLPTIDVPAA